MTTTNNATRLPTQPYKGARDFYPEDMQIQNYIYDTWKKVCGNFGFQEYSFPLVEPWEIFAAKTGAEIVNEQLFAFEDQGGRKLALRPELTPGTVRMIAQRYKQLPQPLRWFMIGNNWRFERPQTGRGREFYQLEANIFGVEEPEADAEIFTLAVSIMKEFGADETMFRIRYSDRRLISFLLADVLGLNESDQTKTRRLMDKFGKMTPAEFTAALVDAGLPKAKSDIVLSFMTSPFAALPSLLGPSVAQNTGYLNILNLERLLNLNGIRQYCEFDPGIIRGFDYSDGLVYEVFDTNPNNSRSLFGGERFDKLIEIFSPTKLPSTGFAMGDCTLLEFLKGWNLLPKTKPSTKYLVSVYPGHNDNLLKASLEITQALRARNTSAVCWLDTSTRLEKQFKYADQMAIPYVIALAEEELKSGTVTRKNMSTGKQEIMPVAEFLANA